MTRKTIITLAAVTVAVVGLAFAAAQPGVQHIVGDLQLYNNDPFSDWNTAIDEEPTIRLDGSAGEIELGAGDTTAPDVVLSRTAANQLGLASGDSFYLNNASLVAEGATADAFETTLAFTDVGADVTATVPGGGDASFALIPSSLTSNDVDVVNSVWGASNALVFEGATADGFELSVAPTDVGADVTATIPGGGDAAFAFVPSSLTTNDVDAANSCWFTSNGMVCEGTTADGFEVIEAFGDPGQDVTYTRPDIASGAYTYGEFTESICTGPLTTGSVDTMGMIATRAYSILDIDAVWATAESAGTVDIMPERLQGTEAVGSGDDLLTAAFDGTTTANTVNNGTQSGTTTLAAGDRLSLDFSGDVPGELLNVCVSFRLRPN